MHLEPLYICLNCGKLCETTVYQYLEAGDAIGPVQRTVVASRCCNDAADLAMSLKCDGCRKENYSWRLDANTGLCKECFNRPEMEGEKFEPMTEEPRE